jgi:hypothetical protein
VTWVLGGQRADIRGAEHKGGHMASLGGPEGGGGCITIRQGGLPVGAGASPILNSP